MTDIRTKLSYSARAVDESLTRLLGCTDEDIASLFESMRYSAVGGGKRIRAYLTRTVAALLGGDKNEAMTYASAIEMVHAYSLIHDDLPCIDNDDMRRGKPTNHKVYGEARAILAGDALLTYAFDVIASNDNIPADRRILAVRELAAAAGPVGMVGGQVMDMAPDLSGGTPRLIKLQEKKTGALIRCAARLGCIAARAEDTVMSALDSYAKNIGLAFQIKDDILDRYGSTEALGKTAGKDEKEGKVTFLTYMSREEAQNIIGMLTRDAILAISDIDKNYDLKALAAYLSSREN